MLLEVESAKSAAYYAAWAAAEDSDELPVVASLAKSYCSEAYFHSAAENIQIHGGIGFTWEHPAHLYFKRAKSSELLLGRPRPTTASSWRSASGSEVPGPFRLRPGPAGDLSSYASATSPGAPVRGHVLLCHDLPRPKGSAADVAVTYPALADRLSRESGWHVVTAALRGAGESSGDFSALGWLEDLAFLVTEDFPEEADRFVVGFGLGGVLAAPPGRTGRACGRRRLPGHAGRRRAADG